MRGGGGPNCRCQQGVGWRVGERWVTAARCRTPAHKAHERTVPAYSRRVFSLCRCACVSPQLRVCARRACLPRLGATPSRCNWKPCVEAPRICELKRLRATTRCSEAPLHVFTPPRGGYALRWWRRVEALPSCNNLASSCLRVLASWLQRALVVAKRFPAIEAFDNCASRRFASARRGCSNARLRRPPTHNRVVPRREALRPPPCAGGGKDEGDPFPPCYVSAILYPIRPRACIR